MYNLHYLGENYPKFQLWINTLCTEFPFSKRNFCISMIISKQYFSTDTAKHQSSQSKRSSVYETRTYSTLKESVPNMAP
jgi:hypothetical protein